MANLLTDDIHQTFFISEHYLDILGDNTYEYCLYKLFSGKIDLCEFEAKLKNYRTGRKAFPPALLLRVIFYAYYRGITSSRVIEQLCKTDLKFIALAAGKTPHFTTIADFVSGHCEAIKKLFQKVLMICDESNLIGREHFAIDGCKIPGDASKEWSGTHKELQHKADKMKANAKRIVEKHQSHDSSQSHNNDNQQRELQTIDTLLKNADKIEAFLKDNEKRIGVGLRKKEVKSNVTDNESTKTTGSKGTIQGWGCQGAADEKYQVVVGAEAMGFGSDQAALKPMIEIIRENLSQDVFESGVLLTADTGYSSVINSDYLYSEGINAVVPDTEFRVRDKKISQSEKYQTHKKNRQKLRKDKGDGRTAIPATEFHVDFESKTCICPNGKKMMFQGDHFSGTRGAYIRFKGKLTDCRDCPRQSQCM
ncbi:MAG: transposase [Pseudomonadales bacterium]|nr:transposase [Pseudomonadales bacterium]